MSFLNPTALADAARRAQGLRGWAKTIGGIGVVFVIFAAFAGWAPVLLVIGGIALVTGFVMAFSAERHIQNAVAEAAADVATPFDVSFDQSWIPIIHGLYRQAQTESARSGLPLDASFEATFVAFLSERGYARRF